MRGWTVYSPERSSQVVRILVWTNAIAPFTASPAFANPAVSPLSTSTILVVIPPAGVGGDHPIETRRTGNGSGARTSRCVAPSLHPIGIVNFPYELHPRPRAEMLRRP